VTNDSVFYTIFTYFSALQKSRFSFILCGFPAFSAGFSNTHGIKKILMDKHVFIRKNETFVTNV